VYPGQYYDQETELHYNRFRYYDPNVGAYISQDPIGLAGNNPNIYAYVADCNAWVDPFGLECGKVPDGPDGVDTALPHLNMSRTDKPDGKAIFDFDHNGRDYKIEFHPNHGGADHFDGDHFHIKKKGVRTNPDGNTSTKWFRVRNMDPDTPALPGGGTFAPGDSFPSEIL